MPRISEFYGILIYMYFSDHGPPHFHAMYGRFEAVVSIDTAKILKGCLPRRASLLVGEWAKLYRSELRENWELACAHEPPRRIPPLD
jgi:hypothetical protein